MKDPQLTALIARAIVHLNFNEPDQALAVLLAALTEINFPETKEGALFYVHTAA